MKFEKNPPFEITGVTYNNWVGGQQGVSGIRIIIGYTATQTPAFKSIFFYNKECTAEIRKKDGKTYLIGYIDTSTREHKNRILEDDPKKEMKNELPEKKFPFTLTENEAVISYMVGTQQKYVKVENLKKTETDFYP
jgi:hypothetical protein